MEGRQFIKKKYNLQATDEVEKAAKRTHARTGAKLDRPAERIQNYLDRFTEIVERDDEHKKKRGVSALKKIMHESFVIESENIPESYFALQQQIAREQGHGTIEITPEMRAEAVKVIQADQRASLDEWIEYLASDDALYPDWAKYWALRSVTGMSLYDKEKKQFGNRSKDTTTRFPDLNREALAYAVDTIEKQSKGLDIPNPVKRGENEHANEGKLMSDEEFEKLLSTESFSKYYAFAVEHVVSDNSELFKIIDGEWRVFKEGSDPLELTATLQGHGTGWCTAGESTARYQLEMGDFHVYYSLNAHGIASIPRLAIRMEYEDIAEVRGVAHKQEIDPYIAPVLEGKMSEFGEEGEVFKKKAEDMKHLTAIDEMTTSEQELSVDDLKFLYQFDHRIEGFGYVRDPRINEIVEKRDRYADLRRVLEAPNDTEFVIKFMEAESTLRARLLNVDQEEDEEDEFNWEEYDTAFDKFFRAAIPKMTGLTAEAAEALLEQSPPSLLEEGFDSIDPKERLNVLALLMEHNKDNGEDTDPRVIEKTLRETSDNEVDTFIEDKIDENDIEGVEMLLSHATNRSAHLAQKLMEKGHEKFVATHLKSFASGLGSELAESLIKVGHGEEVAEHLESFKPVSRDVIMDLASLGLLNPEFKAQNRILRKNPFGEYVEMDPDEDFMDTDGFER